MRRGNREPGLLALWTLIDETRALFHRLKWVAQEVHGEGALSAGRRGVLESLGRLGPQTVPQLARARPVSRQHIQLLVNSLLEDDLVEAVENPVHRRSRLLRLTATGERTLKTMARREEDVLRKLAIDISERRLQQAAATLHGVRKRFESARWREIVGKSRRATGSREGRKR